MPLLDKLETELDALSAKSLRRRRRVAESGCAPRVQVDGKPMLAFCSNDYLGLASHPAVAEALREGARLYGAGGGASHLISGHSIAHAQLEEKLADFMSPHLESARALYFCTGYMANLAVITALAAGNSAAGTGGSTEIFSEALNHASLIDGARLSRTKVHVYPHGDVAALEQMLQTSTAETKLVVTDSVFSMDGNLAPLPALLALCEKYQAWLVVDDAHGFGMLGEHGRGALEHFHLSSPYLVYMGTLSKAAGVGGAFVAAHATVIDWMVQKARPYIYTTAAAPALAHALLTSIDIISGHEGHQRRIQVQRLIARLQQGLKLARWQLMPSATAIQPILIGDNAEAMRAAASLYEQGLWVPAIRPPTVPVGTSRLRVTLSAAHTTLDVDQLIAAVNAMDALGAPDAVEIAG
ncbi:8-amino-7-oxononanoate synthase [Undibacterium sp.]|uniref:8-amino-7-oxononanoate synthase n=1 Tax=Undibacterium sp. TaxID=1914977 RepID=UPI00374D2D78